MRSFGEWEMKARTTLYAIGVTLIVAWSAVRVSAQCDASESTKITASDGMAQDGFGFACALDLETAVIGAENSDAAGSGAGAAYVYTISGAAWSLQTRLTASDSEAGASFGASVGVSGSWLVVGAPDDAGATGAAYVFFHNGGQWVEVDKLLAPDGATGDRYGAAVGIHDNVIVVGAPGDRIDTVSTGSAYVYRYNGSTWAFEDKLIAADGDGGDSFGDAVAVSGSVVLIGAWLDDHAFGTDAGAAYVFRFDGAAWLEEQKLLADDAAEGDNFGWSVALDGNVAVVGAWLADDGGVNSGAAYVFHDDGESWVQEVRLVASDAEQGDNFGSGVAMSGDAVVVGASAADEGPSNSGAAYLFFHDGLTWVEKAKLTASDAGLADGFGTAVALSAHIALIGSPSDDDMGSNAGAAYVFAGLADCNSNGVIDLCDIADGLSDDCNLNGLPDECDIADGTSNDVNGNGVPDECEEDCNDNGIPDSYDIAQGFSGDCNENGVPDECDVRDGTSEDCDGDEVPDECEVLGTFARTSPELGPIGAGSPQSYLIVAPPDAGDEVMLTFEVVGDFEALVEWLDIELNGIAIGLILMTGGHDCPEEPDVASLVIEAEAYNDILGGGDLLIDMLPTEQVNPDLCTESHVVVSVAYQAVGPDDCNGNGVPDLCDIVSGYSDDANGNGIPDECEGDLLAGDANCDGFVTFDDIQPFVTAISGQAEYEAQWPTCQWLNADCDLDGDVDFDDIAPFIDLLG